MNLNWGDSTRFSNNRFNAHDTHIKYVFKNYSNDNIFRYNAHGRCFILVHSTDLFLQNTAPERTVNIYLFQCVKDNPSMSMIPSHSLRLNDMVKIRGNYHTRVHRQLRPKIQYSLYIVTWNENVRRENSLQTYTWNSMQIDMMT